MKVFSGFPSGKLTVTPLPNLFFSELLVAIDDLAELKVTLHMIWWMANNKSLFVRASDLRADRTLMQSLKVVDDKPEQALEQGLERAVERGTLKQLRSILPTKVREDLYFLNTDKGRQAFEKMELDGIAIGITKEPAITTERPNIFSLYEQNIGLLTPIIADELRQAEQEYSETEIEFAFKEAARHNALNWSYISKVLENQKTHRRQGQSKKIDRWWDD